MSVEIWNGDELLGLASERIGEYIDNQEARIKALEAEIKNCEAYGREYIERTDPVIACGTNEDPSAGHCGSCRACLMERIKALESRPPWETIEACVEVLRERFTARIKDAERRMRDCEIAEQTALEYAASKDERINLLLQDRNSHAEAGRVAREALESKIESRPDVGHLVEEILKQAERLRAIEHPDDPTEEEVEKWPPWKIQGLAMAYRIMGGVFEETRARIEALMRGLKCYGVHGHYCGYVTDANEPNGSPDIVGKCTCGLDALLSVDDLGSKLPWETTEACAEALREQLAARVEDAERITALEARLVMAHTEDATEFRKAEGIVKAYDATKEDPNGR